MQLIYRLQEMNNKRALLIQEISSNPLEGSQAQVPEENEQHKILFLKEQVYKCIVCRKVCNYTCPKCKKHYCSLDHFRSHNLFCSEQFYQKQVTAQLKSLKVKDKKQKQKVAQMYMNHQQQMQDDILKMELTPERLSEILEAVEGGKIPELSPKQQYFFQQYLQSLKVEGQSINNTNIQLERVGSDGEKERNRPLNKQIKSLKAGYQIRYAQQTPYWQIEDGISYYINKSAQIEQYGETDHPQIVVQRHIYSKQLDEFKDQFPYKEGVINPVIPCHLVQIVYAFVALYRAFDGEYSLFKEILTGSYCSKQNQAMLKAGCADQIGLVNGIEIQIKKIDESFNGKWGSENIIYLWFTTYSDLVIGDMKRIFKNKYLVLETLLKIIQLFKRKQQENKDISAQNEEKQHSGKTVKKTNELQKRKQRQQEKKRKKICKKCEYLIYWVMYYFAEEKLDPLILNVGRTKLAKVKQQTDIKKQLLIVDK